MLFRLPWDVLLVDDESTLWEPKVRPGVTYL